MSADRDWNLDWSLGASALAKAVCAMAMLLFLGVGANAQTPWVDWGGIQFVRVSRDGAEFDAALRRGAESGEPIFLFFT